MILWVDFILDDVLGPSLESKIFESPREKRADKSFRACDEAGTSIMEDARDIQETGREQLPLQSDQEGLIVRRGPGQRAVDMFGSEKSPDGMEAGRNSFVKSRWNTGGPR